MSWERLAVVIKMTKDINSIEKSLLLMLAYYHNDDSHRCDPSLERLSRDVLRSKRHVQRTLRSLARRGFILIDERSGTSNQYNLQLPTREPDVVGDTVSPLTQLRHPTREPDVTRTLQQKPSSSKELRSSSSSGAEEEDFYRKLREHAPGLRSPLRAPARYFKEISKNGDVPAPFDVEAAGAACVLIYAALALDWPEEDRRHNDRYTVPMPTELPGMVEVGESIGKWKAARHTIRYAIFDFVRYDDDKREAEIEPTEILGRIARRPELFVTALEQITRR